MKRIVKLAGITMCLFALFFLSIGATANAACSIKTLKGNYGLVSNGNKTADDGTVTPRAASGLVYFDGKGNVSGTGTKSSNGTITQDLTVTGTYTVDTYCRGSISVTDSDNETKNYDIVIVDSGKQVFGIQTDDSKTTTIHLQK